MKRTKLSDFHRKNISVGVRRSLKQRGIQKRDHPAAKTIRIQLTADRSKEEAERLLREGGELNSVEVARHLFDLLGGYETTREDITFWRVSRDGVTIREFNTRTMCAAIGQNMEFRPATIEAAANDEEGGGSA